jgi:hypothetical protein
MSRCRSSLSFSPMDVSKGVKLTIRIIRGKIKWHKEKVIMLLTRIDTAAL